MEVGFTVKMGVAMILLCIAKTTNPKLLDNLLTTKAICPKQCAVCSSIEMLCSGANITDVLNYDMDPQIENLELSNMTLNFIPLEVSHMTNCKKLNLSSNNIQQIEKDALQNLWNLEDLILSNNSIMNIADINPSELFNNTKNIKRLNLSNNHITDLGQNHSTILISESLEVLDVSQCQILSVVGQIVLSGLTKLKYLNLSNNPILLFGELFSNSITTLNLRGCLLVHLKDNALSGFPKLDLLDISLNDQLFIDNTIHTKTLKTLDISQCSVRIPNLDGMINIRTVFMNTNRIKRLTAYQFANNSKLINLDLRENHIETVDPLAFHGMASLMTLDLSTNFIVELSWESVMATLPVLETLNLSYNFISQVGRLKSNSLRRLNFDHCWIHSIPNGAFVQLDKFSELILSNNPLQMLLPGSLNSSHLSFLDLSYCRISHLISYEFVNSPNLTEVRLTGNRLVALKNGTFNKCTKLKYVDLDDNPWMCDCYSADFAYMATLANRTTKHSPIDRTPSCLTPDNVTGMLWHVACVNSPVYTRDNRKNFSMAIGVILILCVSGLMAIFVAVHENMKTRQMMRRRRQLDDYGNPDRSGGAGSAGPDEYFDEYAAAAESARKMSQLPSYDEAVMLPKPPQEPRWTKRHSYTQTDDADVATAAASPATGGGVYWLLPPPNGLHVTEL
ncbi:leucine-rich repeat-containing protein 15-like isoform X1 [Rhopalosiphum padi]|uniref:leucine-rich repeat-containing protein 15-like isoform X1 n=1 Tax=Rhopalosiphum padi TaxID=40932 RepID=UPI00298E1A4B|nr:leucine-rich repeat-containing protein 15-like isoform X1 [Rhopalosiphum padi]